MLTIGAAFYELKGHLEPLYGERESAAIAHALMEHITGMGRLDRLSNKDVLFTNSQLAEYERILPLAMAGVPMQYIIGRAWFMGAEYTVNASVLIPRPETEELVQWVVDAYGSNDRSTLHILDVGTGSGCIPISLKRLLPEAIVSACDISAGALAVARHNAVGLGADVSFLQLDILDEAARHQLGNYDIIVSNPPYIPLSERERLDANVRDHEPSLALFVPDEDALLFYRVLAILGKDHLAPGGAIFCELDADHAQETADLFVDMGYVNVTLRKDIHGNERMLVAYRAFLPYI